MFIVDTILTSINKVVDKIFPDADVREKVKAQLATEALEWYKLEVADRDSARKREMETKDNTVRELAWLYTLGYFAMLAALLMGFIHIKESQEALLNILMGVLTAGQYSVLAYYFGSSNGSMNKDHTLSNIARNGH